MRIELGGEEREAGTARRLLGHWFVRRCSISSAASSSSSRRRGGAGTGKQLLREFTKTRCLVVFDLQTADCLSGEAGCWRKGGQRRYQKKKAHGATRVEVTNGAMFGMIRNSLFGNSEETEYKVLSSETKVSRGTSVRLLHDGLGFVCFCAVLRTDFSAVLSSNSQL